MIFNTIIIVIIIITLLLLLLLFYYFIYLFFFFTLVRSLFADGANSPRFFRSFLDQNESPGLSYGSPL